MTHDSSTSRADAEALLRVWALLAATRAAA